MLTETPPFPLCRRRVLPIHTGAVGERCLSPKGEFASRPWEWVRRGGVGGSGEAFFWLLFLAKQEK
jgi:hypothetical protein